MDTGKRAFTLIELLVVITVIVVLLALLTPALDQAIYQAELAVCGARQRAVASGAMMYAGNYKRFYPDRAVVRAGEIRPQPWALRDRDGTRPDDRVMLRMAFGTLDVLKDPFCPDIDLDIDVALRKWNPVIYSNYSLWFGMRYPPALGGGRGIRKLGDRLQWRDTSRERNATQYFGVLVSDWDQLYPPGSNAINSHPDKSNVMAPNRQEDTGGILSFYLSTATWERGPVDENFAYDDGSTRRVSDVEWDDDRMARLPYRTNG